MLSSRRRNLLFIEAGFLTALIYIFAVGINGVIDEYRFDEIEYKLSNASLNFHDAIVSERFYDGFGVYDCELGRENILRISENLKSLGGDFTRYGNLFSESNSLASNQVQRTFFLEQFSLYRKISKHNERCSEIDIVPVIYFYDSLFTGLDRQALALELFALNNKDEVVVLSFDIRYEDEALLNLIKAKYDITSSPFVIVLNVTSREMARDGRGVANVNSLSVAKMRARGEI